MSDDNTTPATEPAPAAPAVHTTTEADLERAIAAERKRTSEIRAAAANEPALRELADHAIGEGMPVAAFQAAARGVLASLATPGDVGATVNPDIGMSDREVQRWSLANIVAAGESGDYERVAPYELECSQAVAQRIGRDPRGIFVPFDVLSRGAWEAPVPANRRLAQRATWDTTTPGSASELVGTYHAAENFIEALYNRTVLIAAGAMVLPDLVQNVSIPKLTKGSSFVWVNEDEDSPDGAPTSGAVTLSPKTVTSSVYVTRRLNLQAQPSIEQIFRADLVRGAAVGLDTGGLVGDAKGPTGILNETGVGTVSIADFAAGAGIPTWPEAVEFETVTDTANALGGGPRYVTTAAVSGGMKTAAKDSGSGLFVQEGNLCNGYEVMRTESMAAKTILFGDYSQAVIGMWGILDIQLDRATKAAAGGLVLRAFMDADVAVRYGEAFSKSVA